VAKRGLGVCLHFWRQRLLLLLLLLLMGLGVAGRWDGGLPRVQGGIDGAPGVT